MKKRRVSGGLYQTQGSFLRIPKGLKMVIAFLIIGTFIPINVLAQIVIDTRPFAINPRTSFMNPDGILDVTIDNQIIGVYLKNIGPTALTNVQATLTFPSASGIVVTKGTENFGTLPPDVPVLGLFRASFGASLPGKFDAILDISADSFSDQLTRKIFVSQTSSSGSIDMATVPQGSLSLDANSLTFFGGSNFNSALFPTSFTWTMTPSAPFEGQFSEIPFFDPWWKVLGAVLVGVTTGVAIGDGIDKACQGDRGGVAQATAGGLALGTVLLTAGKVTVATDVKGPFRRGEENTFPLPGELTTSEEVVMAINYLDEPIVGSPFSAEVDFTFTRFLSTGDTLAFNVSEIVSNERVISSRSIAANRNTFSSGDDIVITAQFLNGSGASLVGTDAFVVAKIDNRDIEGVKILDSIDVILRDDGQKGDAIALDGVYTGVHPFGPDSGIFDIFVFAQDINRAPEIGDPLVLAEEIGGILISIPSTIPSSTVFCSYSSDFTCVVNTCDIDGDRDVDMNDIFEILSARMTPADPRRSSRCQL